MKHAFPKNSILHNFLISCRIPACRQNLFFFFQMYHSQPIRIYSHQDDKEANTQRGTSAAPDTGLLPSLPPERQ